MKTKLLAVMIMTCLVMGCGKNDTTPPATSGDTATTGTTAQVSAAQVSEDTPMAGPFKFSPSEYPSWSIFITATKAGLINADEGGEPGILEKKWKCDVVVEYVDYDTCLANYGNGSIHATCLTNGDVLNQALTRQTTVIMPTSTSNGADAICGFVNDLASLKGVPVRGLEKSVAHFNFIRQLQKAGLNPSDFVFENMDPEAASLAVQGHSGDGDVKAIAVWNPFVMQSLRKNTDLNRIADSRTIPEEIVDTVLMDAKLAATPEGERFANLLCDTFYMMSQKLSDPSTSEVTMSALGQDFAKLPIEDMKVILTETSFYATPADGINLFESVGFRDNMGEQGIVTTTTQLIGALDADKYPTTGFDDPNAQLNFTTKFMKNVK